MLTIPEEGYFDDVTLTRCKRVYDLALSFEQVDGRMGDRCVRLAEAVLHLVKTDAEEEDRTLASRAVSLVS